MAARLATCDKPLPRSRRQPPRSGVCGRVGHACGSAAPAGDDGCGAAARRIRRRARRGRARCRGRRYAGRRAPRRGPGPLWFDWNPTAAAASFERALRLNGSLAAAHHDYAWSLVALGRDEEAIAEIIRARDLDPLSVRANNDIGWLYLHLRRPADAERACEHTLAVDQTALEAQACLERAYSQRGLWDAALNAARTTMPADAFATIAAPGATREDAMRALWKWRLERLELASRTRWISPYTLAVQYVLVGDHPRAIDALERARDEKSGMLVLPGTIPRSIRYAATRAFGRFSERLRKRGKQIRIGRPGAGGGGSAASRATVRTNSRRGISRAPSVARCSVRI